MTQARQGLSSIGGFVAIDEVNLCGHFRLPTKDLSNYWCYVQVSVRYWWPDSSHTLLLYL
ncbi:hypothetical protein SAMN03159424_03150 [Pseudomonas sp. NFACC05-1]|nr:hypothetical protein SAMN03159424_03150 [Pseudomonas sp. NFACC05-1]